MGNLDGQLLSGLLLSLLIAAATAWWLAGRYRRAMLRLMTAPPPQRDAAPAPRPAPPSAATGPAHFDLGLNRRQNRRLALLLVVISTLIGLSTGAFELLVVHTDPGFGLQRCLILGAVYSWPVIPTLGLLWRWSLWRTMAAVLAYLLCLLPIILLGSNAEQTMAMVSGWLASTTVLPLLSLLGLTASGRIRAIAPLLFPAAMVLVGASLLGLGWAATLVDAPPPALLALLDAIGAIPTLLLFIVAPWAIGIWPVIGILRLIAGAYRRKRFSELAYLVGLFWAVVLIAMALPGTHSAGLAAFGILAVWLWVPLGFALARPWLAPSAPPPTLLVLRVFQRDAAVEALFDAVTERWRATGNTVLIAGTDLLGHTLDADDLFVFLSRRLGERFIQRPEDIPRRLADFDLGADHDGRYRINECYCGDATWQGALQALVARSHAVLMDLRDFRAENGGCRFELGELARAHHLQQVVILFNAHTDRATAEADLGEAAGRVHWVDMSRPRRRTGRAVLAALLSPTSEAAGAPG
ncbi:hypothetical protein [Denitromonas iodatirespirans]|uniref:Uncharacterized protein n=1 Tax=Denitromonas iodatirespirans TaxID=2795389 RepID=A0A944H9P9_DENI1|nr:hypothetical protein [Denitromonas iodatirespirans]MBT0963668.1 hypothetical protein [Denitromonas iodatirespirans]